MATIGSHVFIPVLTRIEDAMLKAAGLGAPTLRLQARGPREEWVATIVRIESGRTIEAIGGSPDSATRNAIKVALRK